MLTICKKTVMGIQNEEWSSVNVDSILQTTDEPNTTNHSEN